jgi:hypothetical protein
VMFSETDGLKVTFKVAFCPAVNAIGVVIPLTAKFCAFTVMLEIVSDVLPLLVIVTLFELELPAFTLVKLTRVGLEESVTEAAVPLPLKDRTLGELGALLVMVTVPLWLPAVVGANSTLKLAVPPAAIVAGVVIPLTL